MTGASWARGYEVTSWCVCAWITLPHTHTHTLPKTSDIPAHPKTFRYLTSSYHTLRLSFDLLLTHVVRQCYHLASPFYIFSFEGILFFVFFGGGICGDSGSSALQDLNLCDVWLLTCMKTNLMFLKHKPFSYFQFYLNYQVQLIFLVVSHIGTSVILHKVCVKIPII